MGIQGLLRNLHPLLVPPPPRRPGRENIGNDVDDDDVGGGLGVGLGVGSNSGRHVRGGGRASAVVVRHNVRQFAGKSLAIDASSWLHKAAYSCAERLVESTESGIRDPIAEKAYTSYVLDRCNELLVNARIRRIYLVFDGRRVPLKCGTNADRETRRNKSLNEARRLKMRGMNVEAGRMYLQCVKGNDLMAKVVAHAIERRWGRVVNDDDENEKKNDVVNKTTSSSSSSSYDDIGPKVRCVWSPYEADAQLVKLCVDGYADAIITEDSDVLVYSAVVRMSFPILYKLDRKDGSCDVVTMDWLLDPRYDGSGCRHDDNDDGRRRREREALRRRQRRRRDGNPDYIRDDGKSPTLDGVETNDDDGGGDDDAKVEYDDAGFAPVRRGLPPLPGPSSDRGRGRGRQQQQQQQQQTDGAFLSVLRSIARKERTDPGSGVRLFVQACVLSGCDYAPNRLSKVGPVTAFRLAMDASHRDPGERFGRILRNLPAGSGIVVARGPTTTTSSGDGDSDDGGGPSPGKEDDDDDYANEDGDPPPLPPPPDADRDARGEYEELLSKSEAVFYYHLVRDSSTGNVCPLVGHRGSSADDHDDDDGCDGTAPPPDPDERFRPRVDVFDAGLTFVGSAAEASTSRPEPLPPLAADDRGRPQQRKGDDGGWMFTTKGHRGGVGLGRVHPPPWKSTAAAAAPTLSKEPPKETPMQKYLRGMPKTSTGARPSMDNNNPSNTRDTVKSVGYDGRKTDRATGRSPPQISFANDAPRHAAVAPVGRPNPFSSFAYGCANETEEAEEKSPIASSSARTTGKEVMKSSFFPSPVRFDYGGTTPLVERKSEPKSRVDADATDTVVAASEAFRPFESAPLGSLDDDDKVKSGEQPKEFAANDVLDNGTIRSDGLFDYGIVLESPRRRTSPARAGVLREYIDRTFSSDNDRPGPRRVSTSPPEGSRSDLFHSGNSPGDVIDLVDDEEDESFPVASLTVKENVPNCGRQNVENAKASSVIRRKFKSPYLSTTRAASSSHGVNKARPTTSSSALLAGFARQKKTSPASSSSGSSGVTKRKSKPNFFPTKTTDDSSQGRQKKAKWSECWGFAAPII